MTNVFEGQPDARQSDDVAHKVSRFRPTYRALRHRDREGREMIDASPLPCAHCGGLLVADTRIVGDFYHPLTDACWQSGVYVTAAALASWNTRVPTLLNTGGN